MYINLNDNKYNLKKAAAFLSLASAATAKTLSMPFHYGHRDIEIVNPKFRRSYETEFAVFPTSSYISYQIGGENVISLIDTGSPLIWLGDMLSTDPEMKSLCKSEGCVNIGLMSPQAVDMGYKMSITYMEGITTNPHFYQSAITIAGATVDDLNFGVVETYPGVATSILGIRQVPTDKPATNLINVMKEQGTISTASFSMYYAGPIIAKGKHPKASQGEIMFGGYDNSVSTDPMVTFEMNDDSTINNLQSISLVIASDTSSPLVTVPASGTTLFDSGTTYAFTLPGISAIMNQIVTDKKGFYKCATYEGYGVLLDFGNDVLVIPLNNLAITEGKKCQLYLQDTNAGVNIIGHYSLVNFMSYWNYDNSIFGIKPVGGFSQWTQGSSASSSGSS